MICNSAHEVEHFKIYVIGSEGLYICESCKMDLTNHIRSQIQMAGKVRARVYKNMIKRKGDAT